MTQHTVQMADDAGVTDDAAVDNVPVLTVHVARGADDEPDTTVPTPHLAWQATAPARVARHIDEEPA